MEATRPSISHHTTIYTDKTKTWDCETSSVYHGRTVEHGAKPGVKPTPLKEGRLTWRLCPARNQTSGSNPRSRQHLFLRAHKTGNPAVCEKLYSGIYLTILACNPDNAARDPVQLVTGAGQDEQSEPSEPTIKSSATDESGSNWKSTTYSATKLAINLVKESADVFPPLKSVVGGLSAILDLCDVRRISHFTPPTILTALLANGGMSQNDRIVDPSS